ncbi:MAG: alpha/beta fold hydrolase [Bacteroidota bacterium]
MPIINKSYYRRSPLLFNGHIETIFPALFRKIPDLTYERERLTLSDGDFVDLDWVDQKSNSLVLLSHGLEGNSSRQYVAGMARFFADQKWDVLAWHCRSCSGEMNKKLRMYHHGEIEDIAEVITHALQTKNYETVVLIGFSMGGNITMKYLGVNGKHIPDSIKACVAFSSPTDLEAGADILDSPSNFIYKKRFLRHLKAKLSIKNDQFPGAIAFDQFHTIVVWRDFDELYSAPMNKFENAAAFYENASAKNFMPGITIPTLLIQAANDPILPEACYPFELCRKLDNVSLEVPRYGGHVGFWRPYERYAWSERRAFEFIESFA